ncbi:solute carrier family 23 member 3 [Hyla sarda]|uniref:solute carrier family 23 member 3 n=1 Tax=Hyla sarda TaxID=327740 RepID=UPI0024C2B454|nr:solute carrier family 23 member 3 [Hyla sarda]
MSIICCGTKSRRQSSYRPHETPPWLLSFFFALQHLLVQTSLLCTCHSLFLQHHPLTPQDQSRLLARSLFVCGISTSLQSSLGTRLPLVQAPTFQLLVPALILSKYNDVNESNAGADVPGSVLCTETSCEPQQSDLQAIMEVSGALLVSGLLQVLFGVSGFWGWILQFCGPMVIAPVLSIIGLSCYKPAAMLCASNWGISMSLIALTGLLSQTLRCVHLPLYTCGGAERRYAPIFRMLSILLPVSCIWIVCSLWVQDPVEITSDVRLVQNTTGGAVESPQRVIGNLTGPAPWFQFPYPGSMGWPYLSLETIGVGVAMAVISSLSSMGSYILCARMLNCPPLSSHSCNRGIGMEGIGNILSGIIGSICGAGSNVPSAGSAGITQVGSRHSAHVCALLFVLLGCSPRLSQLLMTIPSAVHGGTLSLTYSMAVGGGISFFQYADIDSGRNIFIVGFTMFMALLVPRWLDAKPTKLETGWPALDMLLLSLLTTPIFLVGLFSFILDNTVEGSLEERGLQSNTSQDDSKEDPHKNLERELAQAYGLPKALACLLPATYPFSQLCPPPAKSIVIAEGEDDKLLGGPPVMEMELGRVRSAEGPVSSV